MNHQYTSSGLAVRLRHLALAALLTGGVGTAQAQFYTAGNVVNQAGTYTDLAATGMAIATANADDANSAATPIGFTFNYNNAAFTDFVLNTNGFLKLGTVAPTGPQYTDGGQSIVNGPVDGPETNLLLPFNQDLTAGSAGGTEYRVITTGTAPSRVCTIQWKNVSDKARGAIGTQYANFSFQVKLYETTNEVDFVYGTATAGATTADVAKFVNVGIKGSNTTAAQLILGVKGSVTPWSNTTFVAGPYTGNAHNVRGSVLPDAGRSYRFTVPTPNDAAVQAVYGYDKLAVPGGQPATIRAAIRNAGTAALTNVVVSLAVTGANAFTAPNQTVASLAVGGVAVVAFANVAVPNIGVNTVTVSVGSDDNSTNNSASMLMETNATTFSYITPPGTATQGGVGYPPGTLQGFAAKFTLTAPRTVTGVRAFITDFPNVGTTQKTTVGETLYGVVVDATTGAIIARSADYIVTTADANALHTFPLTAPLAAPTGDLLVGMIQVTAATGATYFPMGIQSESPVRPGTFYRIFTSTPLAAPVDVYNTTSAFGKYMLEAVTIVPPTCPQPSILTVTSNTAASVSFSFTAAAGATGYQIVYGPQGFTPSSTSSTTATFTGTTYTLTGLTAGTTYDFYVRTICSATDQSALSGPTTASTACTPPVISAFPYAQNFDAVAAGQTLPCGISVADVNADGFTWRATGTVPAALSATNVARSAPNAMVYVYNSADPTVAANDWFFSPALTLTAGQRYRVSFYYRGTAAAGSNTYTNALEVKYGPATTPAGQTTTLFTNSTIANAAYALAGNASTPAVADILPATTGTYYVGFHAISAGDQGFLAVDDVTIATGPLATSEALKRAVTVFPNPSTSGTFSLDVRGANARQALGVEVTNLLGQRVYTGTAKDNFRNEVDLSLLAAGIYSLRVRNGEEYTVQQISIVK